jgi:hypothetical protein
MKPPVGDTATSSYYDYYYTLFFLSYLRLNLRKKGKKILHHIYTRMIGAFLLLGSPLTRNHDVIRLVFLTALG